MATVSMIIPVYNAQTYLPRCLDSIVGQTHKDLEILLVNDGSTDNSLAICEEYAAKDERIRILSDKNQGVSTARNKGIEQATSDYILFVDSDDEVHPQMVETLLYFSQQEDADVTVGRLHFIDEKTSVDIQHIASPNIEHWDNELALKHYLETTKASFFPVAKLYKRQVIGDERYPIHYKMAEDALFITNLYLSKPLKTVFVDVPVYFYINRGDSATKQVNDAAFDTIKVYDNMLPRIEERFPALHKQVENRKFWSYFTVLDKIIFKPETYQKDIRALQSMLRKGYWDILKDSYFRWSRKVALTVLVFSVSLYTKIVKTTK